MMGQKSDRGRSVFYAWEMFTSPFIYTLYSITYYV